jgi:hypothetical protein
MDVGVMFFLAPIYHRDFNGKDRFCPYRNEAFHLKLFAPRFISPIDH